MSTYLDLEQFDNPFWCCEEVPCEIWRQYWITVISFIEASGCDAAVDLVANPVPPKQININEGRTHSVPGPIKGSTSLIRQKVHRSKEFRHILTCFLAICCKDGKIVDYAVDDSAIVGYTPSPRKGWRVFGVSDPLPGLYLKGEKGKYEKDVHISGPAGLQDAFDPGEECLNVLLKARFRLNWVENLGQAIAKFNKLAAWAWVSLNIRFCCEGDIKVALGGSVPPSHYLYINGQLVHVHSMAHGDDKCKRFEKFVDTGPGKDGPGREGWLLPYDVSAPSAELFRIR